jgi:hypothetical protein
MDPSSVVASGGVPDSQQGADFQYKALEWFAFRYNQKDIQFELFTEHPDAGKFDDVYLKYNENGITKGIFAQAKHKVSKERLNLKTFLSDPNYIFHKYFKSFWEMSESFNNNFPPIEIESVMILTNNFFAGSQNVKGGDCISLKRGKTTDVLFFQKLEDTKSIFGTIADVYKFVDMHPKRKANFEALQCIIISFELAKYLFGDINFPTDFLELNRKYLFDNILDRHYSYFKDDLIGGQDPSRYEFFKYSFEQGLKIARETKTRKIDVGKNVWEFLRQKHSIIKEQLQRCFEKVEDNQEEMDNQNKADFLINQFLYKLFFVTKLESEDIRKSIISALQIKYKLENVDQHYNALEISVKEWFHKNKNSALTNVEYAMFLEYHDLLTKSLKFVDTKEERLSSCWSFQNYNPAIMEFIENPEYKKLFLRTPQNDRKFAAMKIYGQLRSESKDSWLYIQASSIPDDFKFAVEIFKSLSSYKLLVIEFDDPSNFKYEVYASKLEEILSNNDSKKLILIADESYTMDFDISNYKIVDEKESTLADLTTESVKNLMSKEIKFQNQTMMWGQILQEKNLCEIQLNWIFDATAIGEDVKVFQSYDEAMYIPRILIYRRCLKSDVPQHDLVYDEDNFKTKKQNKESLHLVEKIVEEDLRWKKSNIDISTILKFVDDNKSESFSAVQLLNLDARSRVTIISDIAGMGKSTLFNRLAEKLKEKIPHYWICKIDLNDYSDALDKLTMKKLNSVDEAVDFLINDLLNIKLSFDKLHFQESCMKTGRIILIIDGFDEIATFYEQQVLNFISLLLETKISNFFISTRPEWSECLEKRFLQIKFSLMRFYGQDQKDYFMKFMISKFSGWNVEMLTTTVDTIIELMQKSISDKDLQLTGVPLISKLVAEFFEDKISEFPEKFEDNFEENLNKLKSESFNLCSLYDSFILKSFHIYYKKCDIDYKKALNKKRIDKEIKEVTDNYEILAIKETLKKKAPDYFGKILERAFEADEIELMVKVGLIYQANGEKFIHQTFLEYLFAFYLKKNFNEPGIIRFIIDEVLLETRFFIVRSFMNFWINETFQTEVSEDYFNPILESHIENDSPISVASSSRNSEIVKFVYFCLTNNSETFEKEKQRIENYLMIPDKYGVPSIFHYVKNSDGNFYLLDLIKKDFRIEFIKEIFNRSANSNKILFPSSFHGEIVPKLLKWLRINFKEDPEFIRQQLLSGVDYNLGILDLAFMSSPNDQILILLEEIENWRIEFGNALIEELYLRKSEFGTIFLFHYAGSQYFDTNFLIEILEKLRVFFAKRGFLFFFNKILLSEDRNGEKLFHYFCERSKNLNLIDVLKWVRKSFSNDRFQKFLFSQDLWKYSLFQRFVANKHNSISSTLSLLRSLETEFELTKLTITSQIYLHKNYENETFVGDLLLSFKNLQEFIEINDFLLSEELFRSDEIISQLILAKTSLFYISQNEETFNFLKNRQFGSGYFVYLVLTDSLLRICQRKFATENLGVQLQTFLNIYK